MPRVSGKAPTMPKRFTLRPARGSPRRRFPLGKVPSHGDYLNTFPYLVRLSSTPQSIQGGERGQIVPATWIRSEKKSKSCQNHQELAVCVSVFLIVHQFRLCTQSSSDSGKPLKHFRRRAPISLMPQTRASLSTGSRTETCHLGLIHRIFVVPF